MARLNVFDVKLDTSAIDGLTQRLSQLDPDQLGKELVSTLNRVTKETYDESRKVMLRSVNLRDEYIQRKMKVSYATSVKPEAVIFASGEKKNLTTLAHYGALQLTEKVNWSNKRIREAGHEFGKWPGWTERTGSKDRGIAVNRKAAGSRVSVSRSKSRNLPSVFSIPKFKDNDNNKMLFTRGNNGKLKALYGPSVYQLFRTAADNLHESVADSLAAEIGKIADSEFQKVLG